MGLTFYDITGGGGRGTVITLADAAQHLRIDDTIAADSAEQTDVTEKIKAAQTWVERYTRRWIVPGTFRATFAKFPTGSDPIVLPHPNLTGVVALTYWLNGTQQTVNAGTSLVVGQYCCPPMIAPVPGFSWPGVDSRIDAITLDVSFGTDSMLPLCKQVVRELVGAMYANREAETPDQLSDAPKFMRALDLARFTEIG